MWNIPYIIHICIYLYIYIYIYIYIYTNTFVYTLSVYNLYMTCLYIPLRKGGYTVKNKGTLEFTNEYAIAFYRNKRVR